MSIGKSDHMDKLVRRVTNGLHTNKYKDVDYERLKASVSEKRFGSIKTSMKVAKIENLSKQHKETSILKQHHLIWHKEFFRLQHLRKKAETDVEHHLRNNRDQDVFSQIYSDFDYCEAGLSTEFDAFKKATVDPVWDLRDDLRFWLTENREDVKLGSPDVLEKHAEITTTIKHVTGQQDDIMKKLYHEQKCLEDELRSDTLLELCPPSLEKHVTVNEGIPQEAIAMECPDQGLKSNVLQEFLVLDEKYNSQIDNLACRHALALSLDDCGDWDVDEHFKFVAIHDQYPRELPNRRTLLFNRLKRHLPKKSRSCLSDHEDWWMDYKYYHERLKGIYSDWARDKRELLAKSRIVFAEANLSHELEEVRNEHNEKQRQLCRALYEQVREWREKKMEMMQMEAELRDEKQRAIDERMALEKEAEEKRRRKDKDMIGVYNAEKERQMQEREEATRLRLKEMQEEMVQQAVYDLERIKFREEQLSEKLQERQLDKEKKARDDEEKEERLERLREQVRIIAESDPTRTMKGTKAWEAHHLQEEDEEDHATKPLFDVHGYTSKQITADPRVKLENRLREAGLHTSDYARTLLRNAKPPSVPRKDLKHTFKFNND